MLLALLGLAFPVHPQSLDAARALHGAGRLAEALAAYRAVAANPAAPPADVAVAHNNACVLLIDLGDYRAALDECRGALVLRRGLGDPRGLSRTLNNLGLALYHLGRHPEAAAAFDEALGINRRRGDVEAEVINLANLGLVATATGRYGEALRLHGEADSLAAGHAAEPWAAEQQQIARINRGVVLEKLGAYREALDLYRQAVDREATDPRRRAALRVNVGVIYRNLGDPVRAVAAFEEAIAAYRELGDTAALSNAYLNLGIAEHLNLGRPVAAEEALRHALALARDSGDRGEEVQDLFYLGRLLLDRGRLDEAGEVFRRCLDGATASGSAEGTWSAREGLGRVAFARGDLAAAREHLAAAIAAIEGVRQGLAESPLRAGYFGDKRSVYQAAVDVLAAAAARKPGADDAAAALAVAQKAKARELLDALGTAGWTASPLAAVDIRRRLGDGTLLEYFAGERGLYLWVVQAGELRMLDLGPPQPILAAAVAVHRDLAAGRTPDPDALAALSRTLLAPAGDLTGTPPPLWIVPDGALAYLPFELLSPAGAAGQPLVERIAVSYLPSASVLAALPGPPPAPARSLLAVGAPRLAGDGAAPLAPRQLLISRFGLAPLPAAARELPRIADLLGGQHLLLSGAAATVDAFRREAARGARVVHLATHTVLDERPQRGAAILFSPTAGDEGLLHPGEIASLDCRAELTVLASCRSAVEGADGGLALSSLAGAFLAAGSSGVVATLWDVGDEPAAAFMEQLYFQLGRGVRPAEALRLAKLRLRSQAGWSEPGRWAGYVLFGDPPPVAAPARPPPWLLLAAAAAVIAAAGFLWGWTRRRRSLPV